MNFRFILSSLLMRYFGILFLFLSIFPLSVFAVPQDSFLGLKSSSNLTYSSGGTVVSSDKENSVYNPSLGKIIISGNTNSSDMFENSSSLPNTFSDILNWEADFPSFFEKIKEDFHHFLLRTRDILNPFWSLPDSEDTPFWIQFSIPVSNSGNTNILPTGNIQIFDEDGNILSAIGKASMDYSPTSIEDSPEEEIVNYLPINSLKDFVLPGSTSIFHVDWQWFAYHETTNDSSVIKYHSPEQLYSQSYFPDEFVWPWEKMWVQRKQKTLHAQVTINFPSENKKLFPLTRSVDIPIQYESIEKSVNYGFITLVILFFLFCIIQRKRNKKMRNLKKITSHKSIQFKELEEAKILAKKLIEKKSLKKISNQQNISPVKRIRSKKINTDISPENSLSVKPIKTVRKKPTQKSETPIE